MVSWFGAMLLTFVGAPSPLTAVVSPAIGGAVVWVLWKRRDQPWDGLRPMMSKWALIIGGIGFAGGFFGPMIFAPGANQGPMLGIFITGPLGFLAGAIVGAVLWLKQQRQANAAEWER
jgi:hypothetical protein